MVNIIKIFEDQIRGEEEDKINQDSVNSAILKTQSTAHAIVRAKVVIVGKAVPEIWMETPEFYRTGSSPDNK